MTLGILVFQRAKTNRANQVFLILVSAITAWAITNYLTDSVSNVTLSLWFARFANFTALLSVLFIWIFNGVFSRDKSIKSIKKKILIFIPALVISLTPLGVQEVTSVDAAANQVLGVGYVVIVLTLIYGFCAGIFELVKSYRATEDKYHKKNLQLIIIGAVAAFIFAIVTNVFLPIIFSSWAVSRLGPVFTLFLIGSMTYGIARHRLFDVRPVVARLVAYTFSLFIIVVIYSAIAILIANQVLSSEITVTEIIIFALFSALTALIFQPVKRYFDKFTNKYFYRDSYEPQEVINQINSTLVNAPDIANSLAKTSKIIESEFKAHFANFYLVGEASVNNFTSSNSKKDVTNMQWQDFSDYLNTNSEKTLVATDEEIAKELQVGMRKLDVECAIKMTSNNEVVGYLLIGERKSGNAYTSQDLQLLEIIADEVAITVQNTLRFDEISKFNITLQRKINAATAELQKSNEKLKALDEAKDEFISMASHQLRTPLTSVKGYISMILEGDAGEINETQRKFLNQSYISSQRMVYLISDLLNVSRLKTGKFVIEPKPTYLPTVVESEIEQLQETAKSRGLKVEFTKPKSFPTLNLDENKIRQVIMNLADNAIYYTPVGGKINLNLSVTNDSVAYTVTDTGIGVPKSEQHHLFTKFYRAANAKKARPDGTGLGLFMAKKVVIAQGGAMIFKTTEGKGSTFGFSFPLNKLEVQESDKI